jgi:hypothetical protein
MDWRSQLPILRQAEEAQALASGQGDMSPQPGGQQDALRHALWNARMAQDYGRPAALLAGGAHEALGLGTALFKDPKNIRRVWDESVMDFKNNLSGMNYGAKNPKATPEELVRALRGQPLEALPPYWNKK